MSKEERKKKRRQVSRNGHLCSELVSQNFRQRIEKKRSLMHFMQNWATNLKTSETVGPDTSTHWQSAVFPMKEKMRRWVLEAIHNYLF